MLHAWATGLAVAVLAPLAAPGYVLAYDMVFVPHQPLRADLLAPADALPRAVPLDAAVALATQAVPGWLVQRVVLFALIAGAAVGAGRLVPGRRPLTRIVAAAGYAWTPFLAERLLLGQWGLLLCYAALPWLVRAALDLRAATEPREVGLRAAREPHAGDSRERRAGALPRLVLAAAVAALTPTGGLIALATAAVLLIRRRRPGRGLLAVAAVAALNAPWVATAAVSAAAGVSDPDGVAAFAARGENWSGVLGALAGTGGVWNAQTVPGSRASVAVPVVTLLLLAVAVAGWPALRARWASGAATRLTGLAAAGFALAAAGTAPGGEAALRWLVVHVPGAGLLRDGQKFLIPYALVLAVCAALGVERLAARLGRPVLVGGALLPLVLLPDLAFGGAGRLRPVSYPADWDAVARRVAEAPGEVVSLPLNAYRGYGWNGGRVVLDPAPRYLPAPVVVDDTLLVGQRVVEGENPRAAQIRRRLAGGGPVADAAVRWVLVQHGVGGDVPAGALAGLEVVHSGSELTLYANPANQSGSDGAARVLSGWPLAGYLLAGGVVAMAAFLIARARLPRGNVPARTRRGHEGDD